MKKVGSQRPTMCKRASQVGKLCEKRKVPPLQRRHTVQITINDTGSMDKQKQAAVDDKVQQLNTERTAKENFKKIPRKRKTSLPPLESTPALIIEDDAVESSVAQHKNSVCGSEGSNGGEEIGEGPSSPLLNVSSLLSELSTVDLDSLDRSKGEKPRVRKITPSIVPTYVIDPFAADNNEGDDSSASNTVENEKCEPEPSFPSSYPKFERLSVPSFKSSVCATIAASSRSKDERSKANSFHGYQMSAREMEMLSKEPTLLPLPSRSRKLSSIQPPNCPRGREKAKISLPLLRPIGGNLEPVDRRFRASEPSLSPLQIAAPASFEFHKVLSGIEYQNQ